MGASVLFASGALAIAPGSTVDSDGCEWHYGLGSGGVNWCNTGDKVQLQAVAAPQAGYDFTNNTLSNVTAYAAGYCFPATSKNLIGGLIGSTPHYACSDPVHDVPYLSVCGQNSKCGSKP